MKIFRGKTWAVFVFAVVIALMMFVRFAVEGEGRKVFSQPTTYDSGKSGYRAAFLLTKKLGYSRARMERDFGHIEGDGLLLILRPYRFLMTDDEADGLVKWVRKGNTALLATDVMDPILDALDTKVISEARQLIEIAPGEAEETASGIKALLIDSSSFIEPSSGHPSKSILESEGRKYLISYAIGRGHVLVFSDAGCFSNGRIADKDNALLFSNICRAYAREGTVFFDEFHHGYRMREISGFTLSPVGKVMILQALLGVACFLWYCLPRFGKPRRMAEPARKSKEYVISLAGLFMKAGAGGYIFGLLFARYRTTIARFLGAVEIEDNAAIAHKWAERFKDEPGEILVFLNECERLAKERHPEEKAILEAARKLQHMEERFRG